MIRRDNPYERIFRLRQRKDQFGEMAWDLSNRWTTALFADDYGKLSEIEQEIEHVEFLIKLDENNG